MWNWDYVANEMDIIYLIRKKKIFKKQKLKKNLNWITPQTNCIYWFSAWILEDPAKKKKKNLYSQKQPNEDIRK